METALSFSSPEFITKLQQRDPVCIDQLVRTYTKQLINASYGLGFSDDDANELVQSVWSTFFFKVPTFEGRSHIRTYLFGILYNKAKELKRDKHKYATKIDPFDEIMSEQFAEDGHWKHEFKNPEKFLGSLQTLEIIQMCMEKLPVQQKMAFHLKEVIGEKTTEICKILDVTVTNLGVLIYRAKNKLRQCVEKNTE